MKPARVLILINDLIPGGAQRVVVDQATRLDRRRFDPVVASLEIILRGELGKACEEGGVPVLRLRRPGEPLALAPARLYGWMRRERPALVHTHLAAAGVVGRVMARAVGGARLVSTLHNVSDWVDRADDPLRHLERATLRGCHAVVAVSESVREACARRAPELAARLHTIRSGVDLTRLGVVQRLRGEVRAELGYKAFDFVLGTVARLERRKGVDTLIEAVALASSATAGLRVLIVGDGAERERLESLARGLRVDHLITWLGAKPDAARYLAAMDVFAAPSRTEGLGLAAVEALAAGVPVLASRVGGLPEVVVDRVCGLLLPPERAGEWADAIEWMQGSHEELSRMALAAPQQAVHFSLRISVDLLEQLYARLLGLEQIPLEEAA